MSDHQQPSAPGRGLVTPRNVVAAVLAVLVVVFIAENWARVRIRLIVPVVTVRLWEALLGTLVAGMLSTLLIQRHRRKAAARSETQERP